ncbi:hypothetical protein MHYP_G00187480 [Metynnis hypsauchen]
MLRQGRTRTLAEENSWNPLKILENSKVTGDRKTMEHPEQPLRILDNSEESWKIMSNPIWKPMENPGECQGTFENPGELWGSLVGDPWRTLEYPRRP